MVNPWCRDHIGDRSPPWSANALQCVPTLHLAIKHHGGCLSSRSYPISRLYFPGLGAGSCPFDGPALRETDYSPRQRPVRHQLPPLARTRVCGSSGDLRQIHPLFLGCGPALRFESADPPQHLHRTPSRPGNREALGRHENCLIPYIGKMLKWSNPGSIEPTTAWPSRLRQIAAGSIRFSLGCSFIWDPFLLYRCPGGAACGPDTAATIGFDMAGRVGSDMAVIRPRHSKQIEQWDQRAAGQWDRWFQRCHEVLGGPGPSSVAIKDFNGDGKPDLAVANTLSNNVSILFNQS